MAVQRLNALVDNKKKNIEFFLHYPKGSKSLSESAMDSVQ